MINGELLLKVGMADLKVFKGENGGLKTMGLGSCVGVTLYDEQVKVAGMAHVMLPSIEPARDGTVNVAKYANTAIPALIQRMCQLGSVISRMEAKLIGGAQMFPLLDHHDMMRIGPRNVESCKVSLKAFSIPIIAEDTGGNYGRTVELYCSTGRVLIRSAQRGVKEI